MEIKKIVFVSILVSISFMPILGIENDSIRITSIKKNTHDIYFIFKKKCPGEICGECFRSIGLITPMNISSNLFHGAQYQISANDTVILYDHSDILNVLYEFTPEIRDTLLTLNRKQTFHWFENSTTIKKTKNSIIYKYQPQNDSIYVVNITISAYRYNKIFRNKITVKSNNYIINVGLIFTLTKNEFYNLQRIKANQRNGWE